MKIRLTLLLVLVFAATTFAQTSGSLDTSFLPQSGPNTLIESITTLPNGKILIGGPFKSYQSVSAHGIARLNEDGSMDTTFKTGTGIQGLVNGQQYHVYDIAVQSDGKIIAVGAFNKFDGKQANDIVRLMPDGAMDNTFDPGTATGNGNEVINCVSIQDDGKILIGGSFNNFNGLSGDHVTPKITRLNVDGSLDKSFDENKGANSSVRDIAIQSDKKIVIVGDFTTYNEEKQNRIARLNADGSIDKGFDVGEGVEGTFPSVRSVKIQGDGKILIGGSFDLYNETNRRKLARIHSNGSLDMSFDPQKGADLNSINDIALLANKSIVIAGGFYNFDGKSRNSIARIKEDGSLDATFDPGLGCNNTAEAIAVQADGKVIIGGNFTQYNGIPRNHIARVHNSSGSLSIGTVNEDSLMLYPNPGHDVVHISGKTTLLNYQVRSMTGEIVIESSASNTIDIGELVPGMYYLETSHGEVFKLLKR